MNAYVITIATLITIYAIVVCGLNVIVGYAGQISLGHAAFFGIGAYSAALLATKAGFSFWAALPLVIAISAFVGLLLGLPSLRVREDFLAITTIGINFIVEAVFLYIPFFGGALGIGGIPRIMLFGIKLKGLAFLYVCLVFLVIVLVFCWWFTRCWAGLACFALREEEAAASSMGISPIRFKLLAFVIGTGIAGLGGALCAHYIRFISATDFSFPVSVLLLSMVVVGGMGTLWGPVLGASAYDAFMIICDAIKRAGSTDGRAMRDAIAGTKNYNGLTGEIKGFNDIGEVVKEVQVQIVKEGRFRNFGVVSDMELITP